MSHTSRALFFAEDISKVPLKNIRFIYNPKHMKTAKIASILTIRRAAMVFPLLLLIALVSSCNKKDEPSSSIKTKYKDHIDTTVSVYGQYVAIKLPIN